MFYYLKETLILVKSESTKFKKNNNEKQIRRLNTRILIKKKYYSNFKNNSVIYKSFDNR